MAPSTSRCEICGKPASTPMPGSRCFHQACYSAAARVAFEPMPADEPFVAACDAAGSLDRALERFLLYIPTSLVEDIVMGVA